MLVAPRGVGGAFFRGDGSADVRPVGVCHACVARRSFVTGTRMRSPGSIPSVEPPYPAGFEKGSHPHRVVRQVGSAERLHGVDERRERDRPRGCQDSRRRQRKKRPGRDVESRAPDVVHVRARQTHGVRVDAPLRTSSGVERESQLRQHDARLPCPPTLTPSILYPDNVCTTNRSLARSFAAGASSGAAIRAKPASGGGGGRAGSGTGSPDGARAARGRHARRDLNDEAGRTCATRAARMHALKASEGT